MVGAIAIALLHPFVRADLVEASWHAQLLDGITQSAIVWLAILAALHVGCPRAWGRRELEQFRQRAERLILTGEASTVVDVMSKASSTTPRNRLRRGEEDKGVAAPDLDDYLSTTLDDMLSYPEFIRSASLQDLEFLVGVLSQRIPGGGRHVHTILRHLLLDSSYLFGREIAYATERSSPVNGHLRIPKQCVILNGLLGDLNIIQRSTCWIPIGHAVIDAIRSFGADDDNRRGSPGEHPTVSSCPVLAGIRFFELLGRSVVVKRVGAPWMQPFLSRFVTAILPLAAKGPFGYYGDWVPDPYRTWLGACFDCCDEVIFTARRARVWVINEGHDPDASSFGCSAVTDAMYAYGVILAQVLESGLHESFVNERLESFAVDLSMWARDGNPSFRRQYASCAVSIVLRGHRSTRRAHLIDALTNRCHRDQLGADYELLHSALNDVVSNDSLK